MFFKALALFFASAALAQSDENPGTTQVSFFVGAENPIFGAVKDECNFFPYDKVPVSDIVVTPLTLEDPTCTFYTERDCEGDDWDLKVGEHHFSRPFYVGSFICSA